MPASKTNGRLLTVAALLSAVVWLLSIPSASGEQATTIAISKIKRSKPVDFSREILPILRKSCLPCHNANDAKGDAILETPESIAKGGETGPSAVAGKPKDSLLLHLAAREEKPFMPPKNNKADAPPLTPDELGLISLWIKQGAKGTVETIPVPLVWQAMPGGLRSINALAMTRNGFEAAVAHGNQISLYQLPTGVNEGSLLDPGLSNPKSGAPLIQAADRDLVESLAFSPDGHWLASGGYRTLRLWERQPETRRALFPKLTVGTNWSLPSANGHAMLLSSAKGGSLQWWTDATNKPALLPSAATNWVEAVFSANATELALLKPGGSIEVWQTGKPVPLHQITLSNQPTSVTWLGTGRKILASGRGIALWEPGSTNTLRMIQPDQNWKSVSADPVGTGFAAVNTDGLITIWNAKGEKQREWKSAEPVRALAVDLSLERLAVVSEGRFRIYNTKTGAVVTEPTHDARLESESGRHQRLLALSRTRVDQQKQSKENTEKQVKAETEALKKTKELLAAADKTLAEKNKPVEEKTKARDTAKEELAKATDDAKKKEWENKLKDAEKALKDAIDARDQAAKAQAIATQNLELTQAVMAKAEQDFKNASAALGAAEQSVKECEDELKLAEARVAASKLDPQSLTIQTETKKALVGQKDGTVFSYDLERGFATETWQLGTNGWDASSLKALQGFALAWRDQNHRWQTLSLRPSWKLARAIGRDQGESPLADRVAALAFSPDNQTLASGGGIPSRSGEIKLWSVKDGRLVQTMLNQHSDAVTVLAFSPDGKKLASGGTDKMARIHEVATGRMLKVLEGHTGHVLSLSWRDDSQVLVTAGADKVAKVWDVGLGEQKKSIPGFNKEITSVNHVSGSSEFWITSGETLKLMKEDGNGVRDTRTEGDYLQAGAISSDGSIVAVGGIDGMLRLYNGQTMGSLGKTPMAAPTLKP